MSEQKEEDVRTGRGCTTPFLSNIFITVECWVIVYRFNWFFWLNIRDISYIVSFSWNTTSFHCLRKFGNLAMCMQTHCIIALQINYKPSNKIFTSYLKVLVCASSLLTPLWKWPQGSEEQENALWLFCTEKKFWYTWHRAQLNVCFFFLYNRPFKTIISWQAEIVSNI